MSKVKTLYLDQYGNKFFARTVNELRGQIGGGGATVHKMYVDNPDGTVAHVGYIIGGHWLTAYRPFEKILNGKRKKS